MNKELEALFAQAYQLQYEGQLQKAIALYEQIVAQEPQHVETLRFLGLAYAQLGDMDHAIHYLAAALSMNKDDPGLLNNLANAYKKNNQLEHAVSYYQQALELQPEYAQAHNNLAIIYAAQNQYQRALHHYVKAVNAEPDFTAAHFNLGLLLLQHHELAAAKTQFNNVISLNPEHSEALFYLGVLHLEAHEFIEAERAFQKVLEQDNEHVQALTNLGVIALKREENQLAINYFSQALALDNDHLNARNNLAATFMHHDRFENALMHYDVLLKKEPNTIEYLYNSGVAQMALGHLNEAVIFFEHILHLNQAHTPSLNNLAAIYLKMDLRETSREYLERALIINPTDTISSHMLHAITGSDKASTTPDYAENLFNNYALYYDQHMQGSLQYTIPQHVGRTIHQLGLAHFENSLDLGCGTGLTGIVLREMSTTLTGVDISKKMLIHAQDKGIYDTLVESELLEFLKQNGHHFDLIVAADVLPYFADLNGLFKGISEHLNQEGHFIFTTEISNTCPWTLETTARFSHHPDYIKSVALEYHLDIIKQEEIPARLHNQQPLEVFLYVVKKPLF